MAMIKPYKEMLFALLLCSCAKQSPWAFDQIHSGQKEHRSTRLSYHSSDPTRGVDLELLNTEENLKVYLNIHSLPLAHTPSKTLPITLSADGQTVRCEAYRLEGGQRFLLSPEGAETLIESLLDHSEVTIALASYRTTIDTKDFEKKFDQLQHPL